MATVTLHKATVIKLVDDLFTRWVRQEPTDKDLKIWKKLGEKEEFKSITNLGAIDTGDQEDLKKLSESRLQEFLKDDHDNSIEQFVKINIESAKEWQSHFNNYRYDKKDRKYYFMLQRWMDFLKSGDTNFASAKNQIDIARTDPLNLNFPSSIAYVIVPSKKTQAHGEKLLKIPGIRKKLQYYNKRICSLAYSSNEGLHCFGEENSHHGNGQMFFSKANPASNLNFPIYLEERQKEIDRLKDLIANRQTYFEKLKCLIEERAGQIRFDRDELKIENNDWITFMANGGGIVPEHLLGTNVEIDLQPTTPDEIKNFNQYLRNHVQHIIAELGKFHVLVVVKYEGFLSVAALAEFNEQIKRAIDKKEAIKIELQRIEKKFDYPLHNYREVLYQYNIENFQLWQSALFNAFVNGHEFDYGRKKLSVHEMKALIHIEQVFEYYKKIRNPHTIKEVSTSQEENFEREFIKAKIPFKEIIQAEPSFEKELLEQYYKAELKPSFDLYSLNFYSEGEINKGIEDAHKKIPLSTSSQTVAASFVSQTPFEILFNEIYTEFYSKVIKGVLPLKYYCPDIEKTAIVQTLKAIDKEYEILKKAVFDINTDKYKEAEVRAKNIMKLSEGLGKFSYEVLKYLEQHDTGMYLHEADNEKWKALKSNFNHCLSQKAREFHKGRTDADQQPPSKLTYLLEKYYLNDCKALNKQQVQKIAMDKGTNVKLYVNKWTALKRDSYQHNGNANNIKSFVAAYQTLMKWFENNPRALNHVKNHYQQLKETYPDLTS